jgi:iron complex outermembrane recepter protein
VNGERWEINQPQTSALGGKVKGLEVSVQQSLDRILPKALKGFGFQANYTYADSSFGNPALANLPFTGMSKHSYNLVGFYEAHGVSTRVAYSWRGKYISNPNAWGGPEWVSPYGQLDASFGYDIMKNVSLVAEASNLLNAGYSQYIKTPNQVSYLARFGRQFSLAVRLGF